MSTPLPSNKLTRYVLSPSQRRFLQRIRDWLKNKPEFLDTQGLINYSLFVMGILDKGGYDEEDRDSLLFLREGYQQHYNSKSK